MGLEAVKAAFAQSYRLGDKHAARGLLVWMAFNVLDEPRAGRSALTFFGGYKTAATGLGYRLSSLDDPTVAQAALTAVKRTMRVLEDAGLIEKASAPSPGRTKEWILTLDNVEPVDNRSPRSGRGGRRPTGTGVEDRPSSVEDRPVHRSVIDLNTGRSSTPLSVGPNPPDEPERIERAHARRSA